jgi:hypothetical protein
MITIKRVQRYVDETKDIICNKCGNSCRTDGGDDKTAYPAFDGLIEVKATGGYWSKIIGDMNCYKFSLCESCLVEYAKTFKIDAFNECP